MLEDLRDKFRVERDEIGDLRVQCRPGAAAEAWALDDGPEVLDVWVMDTARPVATANAIIGKMRALGLDAWRGQTGDREVIVKVRHGGDLERQASILRAVRAFRRRKLSPEQRDRLVEVGKAHQFGAGMRKPRLSPRVE